MKFRRFAHAMLIPAVCLLVNGVALADSGWFWQNPLPQGNGLNGVALVNTNTVFAVGDRGTILKSIDGGADWVLQTGGTPNYYVDLLGVSCIDASNCTAVGSGGAITRTTDGGTTWNPQSSGTGAPLFAVSCTDTNTCTAVGYGGTIVHTSNGITWSPQSSGITYDLRGISCTDANTCTAVGAGYILGTTNGGTTWLSQFSAFGDNLFGVSCTDANTCTAVGYFFYHSNPPVLTPVILHTTDGGGTWKPQSSGGGLLYGVSCIDANTCTAVGDYTILRTTDGGGTWSLQFSLIGTAFRAVSCANANSCTVIAGSTILHTSNGGGTWSPQSSGITVAWLQGLSCTDANTCTAVGYGGTILRTSNGGGTWSLQSSGGGLLYGVSCTSTNTCTAVGYDYSPTFIPVPIILHTSNGGGSWTAQSSGIAGVGLRGLSCPNTNTCTVVGDGGTILHTSNGGGTWSAQSSGTTNKLWGVSCPDANTCTVVGDGNTILRTSNGGATWNPQSSGGSLLYGVSCTDANTCTAVGVDNSRFMNVILHTTNGGATWNSQSAIFFVASVSCIDANTCTAVSGAGILRTSNGGATWNPQTSGTIAPNAPLSAVSCVDANNCTAVGDGGTILRTVNGGGPKLASATTISSASNPSIIGQSVTFTAKVTGPPAALSGTVAFSIDGVGQPPSVLSGGIATLSTAGLTIGQHQIGAYYSGNGYFDASTSPVFSQAVVSPTSTTIASSSNPSTVGESVIFTARVDGQFGGTPTGSVTLSIDGVAQPPLALNGGVASFSTANLSVGQHLIVGVYSGDGTFIGSTSAVFTEVVNRIPTGTTIISSINPSLAGQNVTFTATVTGQAGTPTGNVTFTVNGVAQFPSALSGNVATFSSTTLAQGLSVITAAYSGDNNFASSTSSNFIQIVNTSSQIATNTSLTVTRNRVTPGQEPGVVYPLQKLTLTAQISVSGTPTGTVYFWDHGVLLGTATIDGGTALLSGVQLGAGSHSLMAIYSGDTTFGGSFSTPAVIQGSPRPR